jgi:hypothetical protein
MEPITILNRCHRFRGFVYQHACFSANRKSIEVARPRLEYLIECLRHDPIGLSAAEFQLGLKLQF